MDSRALFLCQWFAGNSFDPWTLYNVVHIIWNGQSSYWFLRHCFASQSLYTSRKLLSDEYMNLWREGRVSFSITEPIQQWTQNSFSPPISSIIWPSNVHITLLANWPCLDTGLLKFFVKWADFVEFNPSYTSLLHSIL